MENRLWTKAEIADFLGCSETAVRKIIKFSDFPSPFELWEGANPKWLEEEVRQWVRTRRL